MTPQLAEAIRQSLMDVAAITALIDQWKSEPAIFTRRPIPDGAPSCFLLVEPPAVSVDEDALNSRRQLIVRDIKAYGVKPDDYRKVERLGDLILVHFHRQKFSLSVEGWHVMEIRASGPTPAPVDDDKTVGRVVSLAIRLREQTA